MRTQLRMAKATLRPKRSKYLAQKTYRDGTWFDSKAEADRYSELMLLGIAGEIGYLEFQPKWRLVVNGIDVGRYTADFGYIVLATGEWVYEDVKSPRTAENRAHMLRLRLVKALYGIEIRQVMARAWPRARRSAVR